MGGGTVVERIVIDVPVISIEAVKTGVGTTVAPIRILPRRPDMPSTPYTIGTKVRRL
jgi:hypothetical protein